MAAPPRETCRLGPLSTPRLWTGLWQLSSNAWGSASVPKIRQAMARHVALGYTAFGQFLSLSSTPPPCANQNASDMVRQYPSSLHAQLPPSFSLLG